MPCIYMKVNVQDTVIQQVFSTYVPLSLPMMEDEVVRENLRADVCKEDRVAPPVDLWDSGLYRSWKAFRAIMHLIV